MQMVGLIVLSMTVLAGGLSLSRFDQKYEALGVLGEARLWLLGAAIVVVVAERAVRGRRKIEHNGVSEIRKWGFVVVTFHAYMLISLLWSRDVGNGLDSAVGIAIAIGTILVAMEMIGRSLERGVEWFFRVLIVVTPIFVVAGLYEFGAGEWKEGLWAGQLGMGRILGGGAIASVYLWAKNRWTGWLLVIPAMLLFNLVLARGGRGAVLALAVVCVWFVVLVVLRRGGSRLAKGAGVVFVSAVMTAALSYSSWVREHANRVLASFWLSGHQPRGIENIYLADRDVLFSDALEVFGLHPIRGVGLGGFYEQTGFHYPHNLILGVLAEGGTVGIALFATPVLMAVARWFRPRTLEHDAALAAAAYFGLINMYSGWYSDALPMWLLLLMYMSPLRAKEVRIDGDSQSGRGEGFRFGQPPSLRRG